jgi:phage protein D
MTMFSLGRPDAHQLVPAFRVNVNGSPLPPRAVADLISATVHEDVAAPSMFTLRLINWDMQRLRVTWADDDLFSEGDQVTVQMGYVDQLAPLITGEITGLEPEFVADEVPTLLVRGYDRRHRLMRSRNTRSFTQVKDSDIAAQIAATVGLTARVEDSGVTHSYVLQHNQTDLEFLQERAARIGYEVVVEDRTLFFRPHQHTSASLLTLRLDRDLIEFYPRLTTMSQVGQVTVRGWNPQEKQSIIGQAGGGDQRGMMGGLTGGPAASNSAFGSASAASVEQPVFSQAEADQIARGRFNEMALAYISGDGVAVGRTDLRAGTVVTIEGLGRRFSGQYYIGSATHSYSPQQGYRTAFTVRRNAT